VSLRFVGHTGPICSITVTPDRVHTASNDKTLRVWCKKSGECLRILETFEHIPTHIADERFLYVIDWADVHVFDALTLDKVARLHPPSASMDECRCRGRAMSHRNRFHIH
jgi:WD40 repeat protein